VAGLVGRPRAADLGPLAAEAGGSALFFSGPRVTAEHRAATNDPILRTGALVAAGEARPTAQRYQGDSAAPMSNRDVTAVVGIVTL
jgi:hypothetical protein